MYSEMILNIYCIIVCGIIIINFMILIMTLIAIASVSPFIVVIGMLLMHSSIQDCLDIQDYSIQECPYIESFN